jgi:hypothetical protein
MIPMNSRDESALPYLENRVLLLLLLLVAVSLGRLLGLMKRF